MSSGNAIRGSRVGAGPMGEAERGESAPRVWISFWCANKHETRPSFATDAAIPDTWECPRCGNPAGPDEQNPPAPPRVEPYKTHLAYVKERRSDTDGEAILAEALARLKSVLGLGAVAGENRRQEELILLDRVHILGHHAASDCPVSGYDIAGEDHA